MVIGVDGNVHVGKTTYIKNNYKDFNIIHENIFDSNLNDYDRQLFYIKQEIERKKQLTSKTILDRTIISTIIYTLYSNSLTEEEQADLCEIVKEKVKKKEIVLPSNVYLILYPYKLICSNHNLLHKNKRTQQTLVDYNYYLNYTIFFTNRNSSYKKILFTKEYRQGLIYDSSIFDNLTEDIKTNSKVLLDGCPAIGKTTIGKHQKKYSYVEEFKYKKYTLEDYSNQIDSIIARINILNKKNVLLDTSFLMGITHLFYNKEVPKKRKLKMIDEIMSRINMNHYITKVIYLTLEKNEIKKRKEKDLKKERAHFKDNLNYLDKEINFYKILNRRLKELSNINFIDASCTVEEIIKKIEAIPDKSLLLIDLFYEIKEGIKEGEI